MIPIFFDQHVPEGKRDQNLVEHLLDAERAGIFNWFIEGARRVQHNHWIIVLSPTQRDRIEHLLAQSKPLKVFVTNHVKWSQGQWFISANAWKHYVKIQKSAGLPLLTEKAFYKRLSEAMAEIYGVTSTNSNPDRRFGYNNHKLI